MGSHKATKISKIRYLAYQIVRKRACLSFYGNLPQWGPRVERKDIPKKYWRDPFWIDDHVVFPAIRERLRVSTYYKLPANALPVELRKN